TIVDILSNRNNRLPKKPNRPTVRSLAGRQSQSGLHPRRPHVSAPQNDGGLGRLLCAHRTARRQQRYQDADGQVMRATAPNPTRRRRRRAAEVVMVTLPDVRPPAWECKKSRQCKICGNEFPARNFAKTCKPECSRELSLIQRRKRYAANPEKILAKQRQSRRPNIRPCLICGKDFISRKNSKTCSPEHLKEYRRLHGQKYYLANREKWVVRDREKRAKWSPKPRQCVVCGEDFVVANRKNSRANACPKHRHDRKLQMERA